MFQVDRSLDAGLVCLLALAESSTITLQSIVVKLLNFIVVENCWD